MGWQFRTAGSKSVNSILKGPNHCTRRIRFAPYTSRTNGLRSSSDAAPSKLVDHR
jgi:hypothetical protein